MPLNGTLLQENTKFYGSEFIELLTLANSKVSLKKRRNVMNYAMSSRAISI